MIAWATENPAAAVTAAIVAAVLAAVLLVLWLLSARNTRLLSLELDEADDAVAVARRTATEQGARMRVIRELQDVVARDIAAIVASADAARYLVDTDPESSTRTAARIAEAARIALGDLRRIGTIAEAGSPVGVVPASLTELVASMDAAGLVIELRETGQRFELAGGAELAVNGIVAEALVNSLEHGGSGTEVSLTLDWTDDGLRIQVDDDGELAAARRGESLQRRRGRRHTAHDDLRALTGEMTGDGLATMRERTAAFGGVVSTVAVPGVGFSVSIVFPALRHHNGVHGVPLQR